MYFTFPSLPKIVEIAYPGISPILMGICAISACYHGAYFRDVYAVALVNYNSVDVISNIKLVHFLL